MLRRIGTLLLIPLLCLPGMCAAHSHCERSDHDPSGRDRSPHFHLRVLASLWRSVGAQPRVVADQAPAIAEGDSETDHDADAVYLALSVVLGGQPDSPDGRDLPPDSMLAPEVVCALSAGIAVIAADASEPPGASGLDSPLYLTSCALLI